jgi:hypothetical protein
MPPPAGPADDFVKDAEHLSVTAANKAGSRQATVKWFQNNEIKRGVGQDTKSGGIKPWFFGVCSREKAERVLIRQPPQTFLIRISDSRFGYVLSLRAGPKATKPVKHFIIEQNRRGQYGLLAWHGDGLRFMRDPLCDDLDALVRCFGQKRINPEAGKLEFPCGHDGGVGEEGVRELFADRSAEEYV